MMFRGKTTSTSPYIMYCSPRLHFVCLWNGGFLARLNRTVCCFVAPKPFVTAISLPHPHKLTRWEIPGIAQGQFPPDHFEGLTTSSHRGYFSEKLIVPLFNFTKGGSLRVQTWCHEFSLWMAGMPFLRWVQISESLAPKYIFDIFWYPWVGSLFAFCSRVAAESVASWVDLLVCCAWCQFPLESSAVLSGSSSSR